MKELATQLALDLSTTTHVVDQLVRKKLVFRRRAEQDARVRKIEATDSSKRIARLVQQDMLLLLETALSGFPRAVIDSLPEVLARITDTLNECCSPSLIPQEQSGR